MMIIEPPFHTSSAYVCPMFIEHGKQALCGQPKKWLATSGLRKENQTQTTLVQPPGRAALRAAQ